MNILEYLRTGTAEIFVDFKLPDPTINFEDSFSGGRFVAEILRVEFGKIVSKGLLIKGGLMVTESVDPVTPKRLSLLCIFKLLSERFLSSETIDCRIFATSNGLDGKTQSGEHPSFTDKSSLILTPVGSDLNSMKSININLVHLPSSDDRESQLEVLMLAIITNY